MGLQAMLERIVRSGNLTLKLPGGRELRLGDGTGPELVARITSAAWAARIAARPGLGVGEAYMDGGLVLEQGQIAEFIDLIGANAKNKPRNKRNRLQLWLRERKVEANARRQARANVAHHYDLSNDLYRRFLDADMQYSCAYFARPDMTLEEAQLAKKRHIAAKLAIEPGMKVLDIGCGWGGMAITLAEETGAEVDGVTLSTEQLSVAKARAEARGLSSRARFSLTDYRDVTDTYDRIVSVGMFEHVGRPNYQAYFDGVARLLKDDGVALIHAIGRPETGVTNAWVAKYIFPGGYSPALSEIMPAIERAGLMVTDLEILRLHYAETLKHWRARFAAVRPEIAELYDERFCRMWEFYLGIAEQSFRARRQFVWQVQLAKRVDAVPITRDYIHETETALARGVKRVA
ncbi:MAG: SAM-dependent methyltransferase [Phenylobacterium sp. RIFCSPHIGHO2_01_FULL_69_31]|uniref:SAM-dependent methyltransferase n=1 Tax=Phenylobacterium sp. RIFCSPHIGHO2_01_FULL_69_31 TaxID=1801944 RepID=UPI0008D7137D|nr:cyclopropane-fatty-acyl-phospholipid synthase family protein [Phenylobacterium sp. RIFCSPHIGHO2_01_FULL_69_31]OHB27494.1 MAG: SAM-dependent methyltransferase [Phenylobacterium sp. RIFCSPHIGHO2_01_FULL_69_31]